GFLAYVGQGHEGSISGREGSRGQGSEKPRDADREGRAVEVYLGDVVRMRKPHPCGDYRWVVMRTGMDFRIRCLGCGRVVLLPRKRFEKGVKEILHRPIEEDRGATLA